MYLSFETNELSALDLQIIGLVAANGSPSSNPAPAQAPAVVIPVTAEVAEAPVVEAPAAKPAAKPAPAKKAPAAKPEPTPEPAEAPSPEPEPEAQAEATPEPEEDLVGAEAPTMADAVAAATKLVSGGNAAKVKEALASVDAKRVSEVQADKIAAFLAALQ